MHFEELINFSLKQYQERKKGIMRNRKKKILWLPYRKNLNILVLFTLKVILIWGRIYARLLKNLSIGLYLKESTKAQTKAGGHQKAPKFKAGKNEMSPHEKNSKCTEVPVTWKSKIHSSTRHLPGQRVRLQGLLRGCSLGRAVKGYLCCMYVVSEGGRKSSPSLLKTFINLQTS